MFRTAVALPVGVCMLVLGQAEAAHKLFPYAELVLHGGALSVLAFAVWHAYKTEIPGMRKVLREDREAYQKSLGNMADRHERIQQATLERHERWETERHQDSADLKDALNRLLVTCASAQKDIKQESGKT